MNPFLKDGKYRVPFVVRCGTFFAQMFIAFWCITLLVICVHFLTMSYAVWGWRTFFSVPMMMAWLYLFTKNFGHE